MTEITIPISNMKIVQFDALKDYPDVVPILEKILEKAKAGEIIGIAAIALLKNRCHLSAITEGIRDNAYLSIGIVDSLKQDLLNLIERS